jgi:sarcosine oxidase subunit beta
MLKSLGIDTDLVDARTLRDIDPNVNVEDVTLAGYEPRSGYADPVATTRGFADAAARRGATFILHRPVASITAINGTATGVKDAAGRRFDAGAVCVVAGPWSDRLLAPLDRPIGLRAERAQIAFFRRDPAKRHLAYIDTISGSYFRPHEEGLTLAGLGEWREEREPDPDKFREANDAEFVEEVRRRLGSRIPSMRNTEYYRGHAGTYDVSPDLRPVLGRIPGIAGLYVAAGFSGTGFKTSPAVGAAMAELILTGASRNIDIAAFSFERLLSGSLIHGANEYTMGAGFGHTL